VWRLSADEGLSRSAGDCLQINLNRAPEVAEFVKSVNQGKRKVPTLVVDDEVFHNSPYNRAILDAHFNRA
jgi:hypothetical protein